MKKKAKKFIISGLVVGAMGLGIGSTASAASFGYSASGASSVESYEIRYDGAAWNYYSSPYKWTSFKYSRDGRTLLSKTAYSSKVTGSVYDDLRWGDKYNTKFNWNRGSLR
ncbi:hypothetical protein [Pseudalkalibacillus hwajinpoensis]|uniref:Lactococcin 972 family bacteriocin n=1 Tax=Guptibacillus hwajinpoensis TaxID=208199 RepID=A0A4U1MJK8_9BACL|nr:hypothetical protein [Pseudalkalibacillus hwajinpoensis]TKD70755.1 hypothetical protein FBF83_09065 [Pseudalkalibacillus hwajinpoensis]